MGKCNCSSGNCGLDNEIRTDSSACAKVLPTMAGPFSADDFEKLVPSNKKLVTAWLRSLYRHSEPEWFNGEDLKHIGMPVGGICCGARAWRWPIVALGYF